jgi:hypothetical protein|nr:MAG TPA: minor capsid protein [Caudoviricetes sp.]
MSRYPFTPELLDALPEELAELFRALEITLLEEICSRLKAADELNEVTVQDIRTLRSHGIDLKEIEKAIRKTTGISETKLNKLLVDVVERNQKYYTDLIDLTHITQPETLVDAAEVAAIRAQTFGTFHNLTASMGFLVDAGRTMLPPAKAYQWALDNATMQIQSGAINYNQAIKSAVKQLADSGLKVVDYESGHRDQIDVAVRRAVMTGVNQICAKYTEQSAEYLETPYFEVSAHSGARDKPGPSPWSSHKDWQGRVYSIRANDIYPSIYEVCGLGAVDGLEGANCRHRRFPWVEGVSERTYTDEQLAHIDDGLGCTFDGKTYTAYEATQMQRRIERTIRKQKRLKNAYSAAGLEEDATAANIKLRRLNAKYKEFSKAAGLSEQPERLKVLYTGDLTDDKRFAPLKEYEGGWKIKDKFSERQYVIDVGTPKIAGAKQHFWENLETRSDRSGLNLEAAQGIIDNSKLTLYQTDRQTIKFLADNGYVMLNTKKEIVTAVPEKLRKKYRDYLEGK